jgi:hypothetical protein
MRVIGIGGQAQNGKDTTADHLFEILTRNGQDWKRTGFAIRLKQILCETFGVDMEFVEKWKTNPEPPPGFIMPIRKALQFIGDGFRKIQPTVWLDQPFRDKSRPIIISDVRYINEFTRIYKEGGCNVLIAKPDRLNYDENESESQIRPYVEWFLDYFKNDSRSIIDVSKLDWEFIRKQPARKKPPENIEYFHVFICNCGTMDDLKHSIEEDLVPIVSEFQFS